MQILANSAKFQWELVNGGGPKGKCNVENKYIYHDRTFKAEKFDTIWIKVDQQIRKLLEF